MEEGKNEDDRNGMRELHELQVIALMNTAPKMVGVFGGVRTESTCHHLGSDTKQLVVTCRSWKWIERITTNNPNKSCIPQ